MSEEEDELDDIEDELYASGPSEIVGVTREQASIARNRPKEAKMFG